MGGTRMITAAKRKEGSARQDERLKSNQIFLYPLEMKAPAWREVLLWEIASDVLAMVHRSVEDGLGSKRKEEKLCSGEKRRQSADMAS